MDADGDGTGGAGDPEVNGALTSGRAVRISVEGGGCEGPVKFQADETEEMADELRAAERACAARRHEAGASPLHAAGGGRR